MILGWGIGPYVVKTMVHDTLDLTDENSDGYENFVSIREEGLQIFGL